MNTDDRPVLFDEFLAICHAAKDQFAFLEAQGLRLTTERWPSSDSFKDGFQLEYNGAPVSVVVEYHDMELVIWFRKSGERIPYLFVDHELAANRSGFAGCMFARNKLAGAVKRMADEIRLNYGHIIAGDEDIWQKLITLWHAPRDKRKLP